MSKESGNDGPHIDQLNEMYRYCQAPACRHAALVGYFGQEYPPESCNACDVCLGEIPTVADGTVLAQKILSAVVRTGERYGANYVADVLAGVESETVRERGHHEQSTFNLLCDTPKQMIRGFIDQLVGQGLLIPSEPPYKTLSVSQTGWDVLRGHDEVRLLEVEVAKNHSKKPSNPRREYTGRRRQNDGQSAISSVPPRQDLQKHRDLKKHRDLQKDDQIDHQFDPEEESLFNALRELRKRIADEKAVPVYVVFPNRSLASMVRSRPTTDNELLQVPGVGSKKLAQFGPKFLELLRSFSSTAS
jgi:ATP-dependent DNA helicase RecQ